MTHGANRSSIVDGHETDADARADRLADVLDDPHCRYMLKYLRDSDGRVTVSDVATYVVAQITDSDPEDISTDVERRVQTWFYHGQLPMLDDYGVIDFDPDSGTVRLADDPAE